MVPYDIYANFDEIVASMTVVEKRLLSFALSCSLFFFLSLGSPNRYLPMDSHVDH